MIGLMDLTREEQWMLRWIAEGYLVGFRQPLGEWGAKWREVEGPIYVWMDRTHNIPSAPMAEYGLVLLHSLADQGLVELPNFLLGHPPAQVMPTRDAVQLIRWIQGLD